MSTSVHACGVCEHNIPWFLKLLSAQGLMFIFVNVIFMKAVYIDVESDIWFGRDDI